VNVEAVDPGTFPRPLLTNKVGPDIRRVVAAQKPVQAQDQAVPHLFVGRLFKKRITGFVYMNRLETGVMLKKYFGKKIGKN
jgi:hypothetical protein